VFAMDAARRSNERRPALEKLIIEGGTLFDCFDEEIECEWLNCCVSMGLKRQDDGLLKKTLNELFREEVSCHPQWDKQKLT
jgi:hypothetical protein